MPTKGREGKCKLCEQTKPLCDSHYLPKRLYRMTKAPELKNPNPVMSVNGVLKQVSAQYRGFVFCESCEQLLNDKGERWVLAHLPQRYGDSCPLQDGLAPLSPIAGGSGWERYDISGSNCFDLHQMIYFAMSIFWRGSVHDWKTGVGQKAPPVDLGKVQEPIRQFLLGAEFPENIILSLDIWPYKPVWPLLYPVITEPLDAETRRYWFCVPGLYCFLFAGARIPEDAKDSDSRKGLVTLDRGAADSILQHTRAQLKEQHFGPEMDKMLAQIKAVRSAQKS